MDEYGWRRFFSILLVLNLIGIGICSYLGLRAREYKSDTQIDFPLREGWVVEIRTNHTALLTAASSEYFYLQKKGSTDPQDTIAAKPSVRPINYEDDTYFMAQETVLSSDWIVKQTSSSTEGQLQQLQEETELHVRIYPQPSAVAETIFTITVLFLFLSLLIAGFVWAMT